MSSIIVRHYSSAEQLFEDDSPAENEAPGTSEAGPTNESDVQEIVFFPPSSSEADKEPEALRLVFDMAASDIGARVAEVCDSVYILFAQKGLEELGNAFRGTVRIDPLSGLQVPVRAKGEAPITIARSSPKRHRLIQEQGKYHESLRARRDKAEIAVTTVAKRVAAARLATSREQSKTESLRYLSLGQGRNEDAEAFLDGGTHATTVTGTDADGLMKAMVRIAKERRAVEKQTTSEHAALDKWDMQKDEVIGQLAAGIMAKKGYLSELDHRDLLEVAAMMPPPKYVGDAHNAVTAAYAALASLIARLASLYPILFRVWDSEAPFEVERVITNTDATNIVQLRSEIGRNVVVRDVVVDALRETWQASGELAATIGEDDGYVWHYAPLIYGALDTLHLDAGHFAWRAAEDRLAEEAPSEFVSDLSMALGAIALGAALTGAEPVALAAEIADVFVMAIQTLESWIEYSRQQLAYRAVLNPSDSLAIEPSAVALGVQVFFLILSAWGAKGSLLKVIP